MRDKNRIIAAIPTHATPSPIPRDVIPRLGDVIPRIVRGTSPGTVPQLTARDRCFTQHSDRLAPPQEVSA